MEFKLTAFHSLFNTHPGNKAKASGNKHKYQPSPFQVIALKNIASNYITVHLFALQYVIPWCDAVQKEI